MSEVKNNGFCGDCGYITLENWRLGTAHCKKYTDSIHADISKPTNEYERCPACIAAGEIVKPGGNKKRKRYVFKTGFDFKQLYDYIKNWGGLMRENEHLKENGRIKAERQEVLEDVCCCISMLIAANIEIAVLKKELERYAGN